MMGNNEDGCLLVVFIEEEVLPLGKLSIVIILTIIKHWLSNGFDLSTNDDHDLVNVH